MDSLSSNLTQMANSISTEGSGKKLRKPYTITKSRESWSDEEHDKFLEALQLFDRDWKKIGDFVSSKTVIQIRSHAQKYFKKVQKDGAIGHVPPPRPKRKATHPYPQKASKNANSKTPQGSVVHNNSWNHHEHEYSTWDDAFMLINSQSSGIMPSPDEFNIYGYEADTGSKVTTVISKSCIGEIGSSSITPPISDLSIQGMQGSLIHEIPDFAEVYNFIGSIFDPETEGHVQQIMNMDPIGTFC